MSQEAYKWDIKAVQLENEYLHLSFEQAELVYKHDQGKRTISEKHHLSEWEEWDYSLYFFKKILSPEQFIIHEKYVEDMRNRSVQRLIDQDQQHAHDIELNKEILKYYEEEFIPGFFKNPFVFVPPSARLENAKIVFLRSEYKKFLNDSKMQILTHHFRHYRNCKPNQLELSLLRHQLDYALPNYVSFKNNMDEPTKITAEFVLHKLRFFENMHGEFIRHKFEELRAFNAAIYKKYYPEPISGWHTGIDQSSLEEQREIRIMSLLLIDREKYGYKMGDA